MFSFGEKLGVNDMDNADHEKQAKREGDSSLNRAAPCHPSALSKTFERTAPVARTKGKEMTARTSGT